MSTPYNIELTDKQRRFADEYLIDCNATKAAIRAGYSKKSAGPYGSQLLNSPAVREYIDSQLKVIHDKNIADAEEVMEFLTSVMRGRSKEPVVIRVDGEQQVRMVESSSREKLKAAELIGKRYGMFSDNSGSNQNTQPVVICGGDEYEN